MKLHFLLLKSLPLCIIVLTLAACTHLPRIYFNVKARDIKDGTFIIKNEKGDIPFSASIKDGAAKIDSQVIEQTGYYSLSISDRAKQTVPVAFEVYLEPGHYSVETNNTDNRSYPKITTTSAIQNELSAYYSAAAAARQKKGKIINQDQQDEIDRQVLTEFVKKNPNSITAPHLMLSLPYDTDPLAYNGIYQSLSATTRNSDEGKQLGEKLAHLVKLLPGQPAPPINGTTPDGKQFKPADLPRKIYLVEFWKAGNELSRMNHSEGDMKNLLSNIPKHKDLGIIGISLDTKRDWWTSAIKDDKVTYPQYSDLKGNESVNAANWGIKRIPTYHLVDGNWKILEKDISLKEAVVVINQYLDHH